MSTALLLQIALLLSLMMLATHIPMVLPSAHAPRFRGLIHLFLFLGACILIPDLAWVPIALAGWFIESWASISLLTLFVAFALGQGQQQWMIPPLVAWCSAWGLARVFPFQFWAWCLQGFGIAVFSYWMCPELSLAQWLFGALSIPLFGLFTKWVQERQVVQGHKAHTAEKMSALLEASSDGFIVFDHQRIVDCNPSMCQLLNNKRADILGKTLSHFSPERQGDANKSDVAFPHYLAEASEQGSVRFEWLLNPHGPELRVCELSLFRMQVGNKSLIGGTVRDISGSRSENHFITLAHAVFDASREALIITDLHGEILFANQAFMQLTGYPIGEILGQNPRLLKSDHHDPLFYTTMWASLIQTGVWDGSIWNRRKNGEIIPCHLHITSKRNLKNEITHYLGALTDLAELARSKDLLSQVSLFDPLTRLASRSGFLAKLATHIARTHFETTSMAVIAIDIANFKTINSAYGHLGGDVLLKEFADRLQTLQNDQLEFARLGGDEFLAYVEQRSSEIQLAPFFEALSRLVKTPIIINDEPVYLSLSLGVALAEATATAEGLVKQADAALHQAKETRIPYVVFDGKMQSQAVHDLALSKKLKMAIENNLLEVFYQPKVDVITGKIRGMEALARWRDEQGKFIPPIIFIPLAEKNGLINALFQIIVARTIKDMAHVFLPLQADLTVSINLSAHQLEIEHLVQEITCRVDYEKIPRENIEFEVTESVFINNMESTRKILHEFKEEGFQLSLDDFGTGFSSLTYLNNLPFDTLKIDKSFMDTVPLQSRSNAMTQSIVNLAHAINLRCVAEGVESLEQLEFLRLLGCDYWQGYYFSPPVERQRFVELLVKNKESH